MILLYYLYGIFFIWKEELQHTVILSGTPPKMKRTHSSAKPYDAPKKATPKNGTNWARAACYEAGKSPEVEKIVAGEEASFAASKRQKVRRNTIWDEKKKKRHEERTKRLLVKKNFRINKPVNLKENAGKQKETMWELSHICLLIFRCIR